MKIEFDVILRNNTLCFNKTKNYGNNAEVSCAFNLTIHTAQHRTCKIIQKPFIVKQKWNKYMKLGYLE